MDGKNKTENDVCLGLEIKVLNTCRQEAKVNKK